MRLKGKDCLNRTATPSGRAATTTGCGYKLTIRGGEDKAEIARALLMQNGIRLARRSQAGEEGGGR